MNKTGFLHAEGKKFIDRNGNEIQLRGVALGNWLLLEGYMWGFMTTACNREWLIQDAFRQLAGPEEAEKFFPAYRDAFITETDIRMIAEMGFNSIRIPFNWKHFMYEGPGIRFKEEGFFLLDRVIGWCRKYGLYAFIDMHAAPGGQTGSNIDDGFQDIPRLFIDADNWEKALALWEKIALIYRDEPTVAGYDLLNEPLRPKRAGAPIEDIDCFLPSLIHFYDACVARIRSVDPNHMFSIEGAHWARDTRVFNHLYDPNMCIHFHAYWTLPQKALFEPYMELSEKYQVPLWLGETGENTNEWFTTIFPLLDELGISWNYWQWKKSIRENSNLVVRQPEGWQQMIDFVKGGPHPGFENGKRMLDEWLVNCRAENCRVIPEVIHSILRQPGITIPALSYMEGGHSHESFCERDYRNMDGMQYLTRYGAAPEIDPSHAHGDSNIRTDHPWRMYDLLLKKGEYASYLLRPNQTPSAITLVGYAPDGDAELEVEVAGVRSVLSIPHALRPAPIGRISIPAIPETTLRLTTLTASVALEKIDFTEA